LNVAPLTTSASPDAPEPLNTSVPEVAFSVQSDSTLLPPCVLDTILFKVSFGATSLLVIVQVTFSAKPNVIVLLDNVPPSQDQSPGRYPDFSDSLNTYPTPAFTVWKVVEFPVSLNPLSPVAVRVQSAGVNVPPLSLITLFTSLSVGAFAVFVIIHVAVPLCGTVTFVQLLYVVVYPL